jgi:hypothetical protein
LICFPKKSSGPKMCLSTSPPIPPSKQRMPRLNRGPTTSCAATSGTWSTASGTPPPVAKLSAHVAWLWKH